MICNKEKELKIGMKIELEHARLFPKNMQKSMSRRIALDHIEEFPCYYTEGLIPMERKLRRKNG